MRTSYRFLVRLLVVLGGLVAIVVGVYNARDNEALLRVVPHPSTEAELAKGIVRGLATFRPVGELAVPPCLATYKSGKSTKRVHFSTDNEVVLEGGARYSLGEQQKIEFFNNEPPRRPLPRALEVYAISRYLKKLKPDVTYFSAVSCLSEREAVWLEACVSGKQLVGCEGADAPILMTAGGLSPRVGYLADHGKGAVALILLGVTMILMIVATAFAHVREVVTSLAALRGVSAPTTLFGIGALLGMFGCFATIFTWATASGPLFFCLGTAVFILCVLVLAVTRVRLLNASRRVLVSTETTRLDAAVAESRELAVRVAPDAPVVEGFRAGERHAIVQFRIVEDYEVKSGSKTAVRTSGVAEGVYPKLVPIADASGRGALALAHCKIDAVDQPPVSWSRGMPASPPWLGEVIGALEPNHRHRVFRAEWRVVAPDEPLLIYGGVERVLPSAVGAAPADGGYRTVPEVPLVRGREDQPAFAYVGLESALLRAITMERAVLVATLVVAAGAVSGVIVRFGWLLSR